MVECKYRILVDKTRGKNQGVEGAMDDALGVTEAKKYNKFAVPTVIAGNLKQSFDCGLCQLLTQNDMGPMECRQPDHNEDTCPDIDHLRG